MGRSSSRLCMIEEFIVDSSHKTHYSGPARHGQCHNTPPWCGRGTTSARSAAETEAT